jgi:hypothetical protein
LKDYNLPLKLTEDNIDTVDSFLSSIIIDENDKKFQQNSVDGIEEEINSTVDCLDEHSSSAEKEYQNFDNEKINKKKKNKRKRGGK